MSSVTRRIRLGVAVINAPFFGPALLAKQLASVDVLSGGRLEVGIGTGWSPEEFDGVGVAKSERGARTDETVEAMLALWGDDPVDFRGRFAQLSGVVSLPKPVQRPRPPLLFGGVADAAVRRTVRYGDGWVASSNMTLAQTTDVMAAIRERAAHEERDPEDFRFVVRAVAILSDGGPSGTDRKPLRGSVEEIREDVARYADAGVSEVFFDLNYDPSVGGPDADPGRAMERADVLLETFADA